MPGTTIARGNILYSFLVSITLTPLSVGATTSAEQQFTIPGVVLGDDIGSVSFQGAITNLVEIVNVRVVSNNIVGISFQNNTAGGLVPASGTYVLEINRPEAPNNLPTTAA